MTHSKPCVLVVGAGSIGHRHIRCFLATGRVEVAFVEPFAKQRDEVARCNPLATPFASLDEALACRPCDMAVIATPAPHHVPQALLLMERGLHVLIEKPLCLEAESAAELLSAAQQSELVVAVAYVYRANPVLSAMRNELLSGRHGRPLELIAVAGQHFPTYRPAFRETYYRQRETGGGAIQDALTHVYNAAEWLVGDFQRVVVDADQLVLDGVAVEDTVHVLARHRDGVMASYSLNQHQPANEMSITVITDSAMLRWDSHRHRFSICDRADINWREQQFAPLERDELFIRQAASFLDAIETGVKPLCDLSEGIATLETNLASLRSLESQGWESVRGAHAIVAAK